MQQRGRLQNDSRTKKAVAADEKHAQTREDSIRRAKVRCSLAAPIQNQQLVPAQHQLRKNGAHSAGFCEPDRRHHQVSHKDQEIPHPANPTKRRKSFNLAPLQEFAMDT
jgi:hypothetical protein